MLPSLSVAARSLHVKMHPVARTLSERREVLRLLERYGEVEMFKSLKYDRSSGVLDAFLTIMKTDEAALELINASPIRYQLTRDGEEEDDDRNDIYNDDYDATSQAATPTPTPSPPTRPSIFELRISRSSHPHAAAISHSPLHGSWTPIALTRSSIAGDLERRIGPGIAARAMCDWVTGTGLGPLGGETVGGGGRGELPRRLMGKAQLRTEAKRPRVMGGLRAVMEGRTSGMEDGIENENGNEKWKD